MASSCGWRLLRGQSAVLAQGGVARIMFSSVRTKHFADSSNLKTAFLCSAHENQGWNEDLFQSLNKTDQEQMAVTWICSNGKQSNLTFIFGFIPLCTEGREVRHYISLMRGCFHKLFMKGAVSLTSWYPGNRKFNVDISVRKEFLLPKETVRISCSLIPRVTEVGRLPPVSCCK